MNKYLKALQPLLDSLHRQEGFSLNGQSVIDASADFLKRAVEADPQQALDLIKRSHAGDTEARLSLNALRVETINNFIWPDALFATSFFTTETYGENETPMYRIETRQETPVTVMAEDGEAVKSKIRPAFGETVVPLYMLTTDKVTYNPKSLHLGDVSQNYLKTIDLAMDMTNQIESRAKTLLDTAFGAFTTTGSKVARTYVPHSGISTANLPSTNDLTASGTAGKFRKEVFEDVLNYCLSWGENAFPDGKLWPTGQVFVPSSQAADILKTLSLTDPAGSAAAAAAQNLFQVRHGITWTIIPSNRLAQNKCYVPLSKPVGTIVRKPSLDESFDSANELNSRLRNQAWRAHQVALAMYIPGPKKVNAVRVTFAT